jgi:hypothetical protein
MGTKYYNHPFLNARLTLIPPDPKTKDMGLDIMLKNKEYHTSDPKIQKLIENYPILQEISSVQNQLTPSSAIGKMVKQPKSKTKYREGISRVVK